MANTINKSIIYTDILDKVITAGLTSAPMTANANRVQYNGGSTVKIAKLSVGGLGNYNRETGYPSGAVSNTWEDQLISQDRGIAFLLDVMDADETKQVAASANTIAEVTRTQTVPELDAYRYSKVFQSIVNDTAVRYAYYSPVAATALGTLQEAIGDIQDAIGEQEPLIAYVSGAYDKVLRQSTQLSKSINVTTGPNAVNGKVYEIDGVQIVVVPSARMKTEYAFSATNGFASKAWAQDMNFVVMAKSAADAFVKHQKIKVVSADDNQTADGEKVLVRVYHDCWVYDNKHNAIFVSLKTATIAGFSADELKTTSATNVTYTIATYAARDTGHKFYYFDGGSSAAKTAPACYDDFDTTGYVEIVSASAVSDVVTSGYYGALVELDENGRAVRFGTIKAA